MKKWGYITIFILIFITAILLGIYIFDRNNNRENNNTNKQNEITNNTIIKEVDNTIVNEISVSNVEKEKISPNAVLILKKQYKECGHAVKEYAEIPEEFVNLTQEELEEKYEGWTLEKFSINEIIIQKQVEGVCDQHYLLKEKDGIVAVYKINRDGSQILKEETGVAIEYLTENDKAKLKKGIYVDGEEELNTILEDYE